VTRGNDDISGPDRAKHKERPGRYDAVFLDVDGTLLWVDLDVEGYVADLAPYAANGPLTVEKARGPVWESLRRHIKQNLGYRTREGLAGFKRRNAETTALELGIKAPSEVLTRVADRSISFNPYPESEAVLRRLGEMDVGLYVVSNWDVQLVEVLQRLDWLRYFDGVVVSAVSGIEKPDARLFEEALEVSGVRKDRAVMVGNDPIADIEGAAEAGIDTVRVDRSGKIEAPRATFVLPDLSRLPELLKEKAIVRDPPG
jgi:HAD superfamily hydrolase (TIGR01509 family)